MSNQQLKDTLDEAVEGMIDALNNAREETTIDDFADNLLETMANRFDSQFAQKFVSAVQNSAVWFSVPHHERHDDGTGF